MFPVWLGLGCGRVLANYANVGRITEYADESMSSPSYVCKSGPASLTMQIREGSAKVRVWLGLDPG